MTEAPPPAAGVSELRLNRSVDRELGNGFRLGMIVVPNRCSTGGAPGVAVPIDGQVPSTFLPAAMTMLPRPLLTVPDLTSGSTRLRSSGEGAAADHQLAVPG